MPWRSVRANVTLPLELQAWRPARPGARRKNCWNWWVCAALENEWPRHLSGGMEQRVAIARALAHNPECCCWTNRSARSTPSRVSAWHGVAAHLGSAAEDRRDGDHSISEALLLADRVLVLTQRPGQLRLDLDVPLARPRQMTMEYSPEFGALAAQVRQAIGN